MRATHNLQDANPFVFSGHEKVGRYRDRWAASVAMLTLDSEMPDIVAIACQPLAMENMVQDGSHGN